jgi:hypothetical protein
MSQVRITIGCLYVHVRFPNGETRKYTHADVYPA